MYELKTQKISPFSVSVKTFISFKIRISLFRIETLKLLWFDFVLCKTQTKILLDSIRKNN
jgi:hypothetical protein